jgi:lipoyl(octanoyl) transferase
VAAPPPRLALDPPADATVNFGRDEALHAMAATTGGVLLRVYGWSRPTVSFGRHERARDRYDATRLAEAGLSPTRRLTGGRALVHTDELTYAIAGPVEPAESLRATVGRVTAVLATALRSLGVPVEVAGEATPTPALGAGACFGAPSAGELTLGGRKLAGSAQWRDHRAWLQHGSILCRDDQGLLLAAAMAAAGPPPPPAATLADVPGGAPSPAAFADALGAAWGETQGQRVERVDGEALLPSELVAGFAPRYDDPAWVWQR